LKIRSNAFTIYNIQYFLHSGSEDTFYVNSIPRHLTEHPFVVMPHKHNFYVSILFTKGTGTHEIDFNSYPIKPGYVFTIFPGQVQAWKLSDDIDGYIFFHTQDFFDSNFVFEKIIHYPFFSSVHNSSLIVLPKKSMPVIERLFAEIMLEYKRDELLKFRKLCSLVNVVYIELSRLCVPSKHSDKQNENYLAKVAKLEELINANFRSVKYPKDYARMMNITEKHLNRICKATLNYTTSAYITGRIILEAKRMLVHSKYSATQIAADLGYLDNSYFFRMFKKNSGQTPAEFMNKFRKQGAD